jgi:hypothetical protein
MRPVPPPVALHSAGLRAMTAALVIVPLDPVRPPASAHRGAAPGSTPEPREVPTGAPWMVRLSMGKCGRDVACHVPGPHLPGSRR